MAVLVDLEKVSARRSDRPLFENVSLTVSDGERLGVIGINGTGKSTLLRLVAGVEEPESGSVRRSRSARVGYLDQSPSLTGATLGEALGEGWEAEAVLDRLGTRLDPATPVAALSGGQSKRVSLARVLSRPAELLVLDEPTNHLDLAGVGWLEARLAVLRSGLVIVTHDRHLLERVTTRMVELDRGRLYLHEGSYDSYLAARAERDEKAETADTIRRNLARRELAWLRRGAKARSRKPQARLDAARRLVQARPEPPARQGELGLGFSTPRLGDKVIECSQVAFRYEGSDIDVLSCVDLVVAPRERLGIVGGNGTGKSTLLDLLATRRSPTRGTVEVGPSVVVGYYDQQGVDLDPDARIRDLVAGPTRSPGAPEDVALMERFWFSGELPFARVATLSGGERRRLQLLLVLAGRPNVLLLDEPTNDLDLDTLRALEDLLEAWPGALVVVSHDRSLLERTTDRISALRGDGTLTGVPGGLEGWLVSLESPKAVSQAQGRRPSTGRPVTGRPVTGRPVTGRPVTGRSASTLGHTRRELDKSIARLERRRDALTNELEAARDHASLTRLGSELTEVQARLGAVEDEWLALAEEAEADR